MLTCSMMRVISFYCWGLCVHVGVCSHPWFVCEVDLVPYVDAVTVMGCTVVCVACVYAERA